MVSKSFDEPKNEQEVMTCGDESVKRVTLIQGGPR